MTASWKTKPPEEWTLMERAERGFRARNAGILLHTELTPAKHRTLTVQEFLARCITHGERYGVSDSPHPPVYLFPFRDFETEMRIVPRPVSDQYADFGIHIRMPGCHLQYDTVQLIFPDAMRDIARNIMPYLQCIRELELAHPRLSQYGE